MSKTEAQSEAQKLSALLNVAMAFDHGRIGTDRRFVEMDATVVASVDAELRRLDAENKSLRGLAATCYAGLGAECNLPENWLDALNAAANGEAFDTEGLLPFTSPVAPLVGDEHAVFEEWALGHYPGVVLERDGGSYRRALAQEWWTAWQASRAARAAAKTGDAA